MLLESFQMFPIFLCNKKCRLEHVFNKLMSCLITEFLWIFSYKLHGILWNSMDTLWHSMELHDIPWNFMAFHGTSSLLHGTPWNSMAFHGTPWILHGYSMGVSWNSMDFHGFPWNSMEVFHTGIVPHLNDKWFFFYKLYHPKLLWFIHMAQWYCEILILVPFCEWRHFFHFASGAYLSFWVTTVLLFQV